jgi:hypothetical protein
MRRCFPFIISRDGAIAKWFAISRASKSEIRLGIFRISFDIFMEQTFVWCCRCRQNCFEQSRLGLWHTISSGDAFETFDYTTLKRLLFGYRLQEIMWFFCIWHFRCSCFRFVTNMHTNFDILKSDLCFWKHILKSYELSSVNQSCSQYGSNK